MVYFICMGLLDLWGAQAENYKYKWKYMPTVGFEPGTFRLGSGDRFLVHTGSVHGGFAVLLRTSCYEFVIIITLLYKQVGYEPKWKFFDTNRAKIVLKSCKNRVFTIY